MAEIVKVDKRKVRKALTIFNERILRGIKESRKARTIPLYPLD